ncbi:hypothetical protein E1B28_012985 [Marasmius oreades]|uniref:Tyrosinase copper-binding domain-containing protein n=1 Tax=Marasmius oreades TaxID=181124 RepID=A0A9P7RPR2_9AGAR|nr:uncharacterized protein E1B28_012985 [Marasmius oreades]KAG7087006.1 hypothetical protein E1B28_012985 [Marasmius oreades]
MSLVAGIHGLPHQAWSGDPTHEKKVGYDKNDPKDTGPKPSRFGGYCNHGSVLFPSWHRPYVLAIEQAIGLVAEALAKILEDSRVFPPHTWAQAADRLRFPWWDWAKDAKKGLPHVLTDDRVPLVLQLDDKTAAATVTCSNPLSYYLFKSIPDGFRDITDPKAGVTAYFSKWMRTLRHAPSSPNANESNTEALNKELIKNAKCLTSRVASMFSLDPNTDTPTDASRIPQMSCTITPVNPSKEFTIRYMTSWEEMATWGIQIMLDLILYSISIIAMLIGSMHCGNMYIPKKFTYIGPWETKGRVYSFTQGQGTYALVYNSELLGQTELAPFRREDGEYWTTDDVRYFYSFDKKIPKYYTYPVVEGEIDISKLPTAAEREKYRKILQCYYGIEKSYTTLPPKFASFLQPLPQQNLETQTNTPAQIVIGVQTSEFAFNGPYSIEVSYTHTDKEEEHVGTISVFTHQPDSNCAACKVKLQLGSTIHGLLPVPDNIIQDLVAAIETEDTEGAAPEILIDTLKGRLSATILDQHKKPVAHAKPGSGQGFVEDEDGSHVLEPHLTPVITVASAHVDRDGGGKDRYEGPVRWFGWKNHGEVFHPDLDPEKTGWRLELEN